MTEPDTKKKLTKIDKMPKILTGQGRPAGYKEVMPKILTGKRPPGYKEVMPKIGHSGEDIKKPKGP